MKAEIVTFDEFNKIRCERNLGKIIATSGGFDPVHSGHLYGIHESKKLGETMVVIVNGDNFLKDKKGKPFMMHQERMDIISYIKGVDFVIPYETVGDHTCIVALKKLKPHVYTKSGNDRTNKETIPEWQTCEENNIEIVIIPPAPTDSVHSSLYLKRWIRVMIRQKVIKYFPYNILISKISEKIPKKYKKILKEYIFSK
jgi:cytidyltransferase-like protein